MYEPPTPFELLDDPPTKFKWKRLVKSKLVQFWSNQLKSEAAEKSTLKFWNNGNIKHNVCSQIWEQAGSDTVSVHKARC